MKITDLRELKEQELQSELFRLQRHLFDLRSQAVTEKLEDVSQLQKTRREVARLLTVMNERGRGAAAGASR